MRDEENRWLAERAGCGDAYDAIYQQRAAAGEDVHGEADFVAALGGHSVLNAGLRYGARGARAGVARAGCGGGGY